MERWFQKKYRVKVDNKQKAFAETDTKKKTIKINVKKSKATHQKGELLDTLAHETLGHAMHPNMSEKNVRKMTAARKLSEKTKRKLYALVSKK